MVTTIGGSVEPAFEAVRERFERNFDAYGEVGASCCVYVGGRRVVDLWGGVADVETRAPYTSDTIQVVFSSTKGAAAACAALLIQRGQLDPDAPVARYWPEFAKEGKGEIPVRWVLSHRAGLPYVDADLTLDDVLAWDPIVDALANQKPIWEPGTTHGYHALTYGWLLGELVRRVTGQTLGSYFREQIAEPLGLDFWIGLPDTEQRRVAPLITFETPSDPRLTELLDQFIGPETLLRKALTTPSGTFESADVFNLPAVRAAEIPAANAVTNGRSMARLYAGLIGGLEDGPEAGLLTDETIATVSTCQTSGPDAVIYLPTSFGLGFWTCSEFARFGGARSFGHAGMGGSVGFGDPEHDIGFGYVMNRMELNIVNDVRSRGLIRAVYESVGVDPAYT